MAIKAKWFEEKFCALKWTQRHKGTKKKLCALFSKHQDIKKLCAFVPSWQNTKNTKKNFVPLCLRSKNPKTHYEK